jgi:hypothetical protein
MRIWEGGQQISVPDQTVYDFDQPGFIYIGVARPGVPLDFGAWQITRIAFDGSGNPTAKRKAMSGEFKAKWTDRLTLEY